MIRNINASSLIEDFIVEKVKQKKVSPVVGEISPLMYESLHQQDFHTFYSADKSLKCLSAAEFLKISPSSIDSALQYSHRIVTSISYP